MILRACKCGRRPKYTSKVVSGIYILRIVCACGASGATLMYTKREQRQIMKQAAADGWNLGG